MSTNKNLIITNYGVLLTAEATRGDEIISIMGPNSESSNPREKMKLHRNKQTKNLDRRRTNRKVTQETFVVLVLNDNWKFG